MAAAVRRELAAAEARYEMARAEMLTLREEYLTSSQELQRRNEELEEAQRQLDSSNRQLIRRNQELTRLAGDLSNLLAAVDIPILMLDSDLRIRRFTGNADQVLNLTASDVGRPSAKIAAELEVPDWDRLLLAVMENFHTVEREV
ncbi:MAG TPA: PAS domain-containing protein, partial [Bryobacteraceae bacterium]|nr:PAS domain-containing protein [Bryobacteraceae bacterium]